MTSVFRASVFSFLSLSVLSSCATFSRSGGDQMHGIASWYGSQHQGKRTASGEKFDMNQLTAAHRTLAFGTRVRVRSVSDGKEVSVRINDRGPFAKGRIIDVSRAAAKELGMLSRGEIEVELSVLTSN